MSHFNQEYLRDFLMAMKASGIQPSATLTDTVTKISGLEAGEIDTIFAEVFDAPEIPRENLAPMELTT